MDKAVFEAVWERIVLHNADTVQSYNNIQKGLTLMQENIPKLKNIAGIQKLNKNEAIYPTKVYDQIIDVFKFHISNWIQKFDELKGLLEPHGVDTFQFQYVLNIFRNLVLLISLETKEKGHYDPTSRSQYNFIALFLHNKGKS